MLEAVPLIFQLRGNNQTIPQRLGHLWYQGYHWFFMWYMYPGRSLTSVR